MIKSDDKAHSLMQSLNDVYMASLDLLNRKSHVLDSLNCYYVKQYKIKAFSFVEPFHSLV